MVYKTKNLSETYLLWTGLVFGHTHTYCYLVPGSQVCHMDKHALLRISNRWLQPDFLSAKEEEWPWIEFEGSKPWQKRQKQLAWRPPRHLWRLSIPSSAPRPSLRGESSIGTPGKSHPNESPPSQSRTLPHQCPPWPNPHLRIPPCQQNQSRPSPE